MDVTTIKIVALPSEHGASVMLGESLLAGLLIGSSVKGIPAALGWIFLFLMAHSFKIALKDHFNHVYQSRTSAAFWCCGGFGFFAALFTAVCWRINGPAFLWPLAAVAPLGLVHFWAVIKGGKKEFLSEIAGALSLGAAAACIVLAAGHAYMQAWTLWGILAVRALTSVVYVRERLRFSRGQEYNFTLVVLVHLSALMILTGLVIFHDVKPFILAAGVLLAMRLFLVRFRGSLTPKQVGLQEAALGVVFVLMIWKAF